MRGIRSLSGERDLSGRRLVTLGGNGDPGLQDGVGIHLYWQTPPCRNRFFYNADGEMLILPQQGRLLLRTELGILTLRRAVGGDSSRYQVPRRTARWRRTRLICENYGQSFRLPELGPIGANGLANTRDFLTPSRPTKTAKASLK